MSFKGLQIKGQAYVGVTLLQGLYLLEFNVKCITCDSEVTFEMERLRHDMPLSLTTNKLLSRPDCMLRVLFFNAQSVGQLHHQGMTADVFLYSAHVLALSETWIRGNINIPDYVHRLYCPRLNGSRGGVALLSVNDCKMRYIPLLLKL